MKDLFIYLYNYMIFLIVIGLRDILVILLMLEYYILHKGTFGIHYKKL